jgi:hypothetical protein
MWRLALSKHVSAATTAIGTTEILCRSASVAVMQSKCNITVASCTIDCSYAEPRRTVLYSSFGFVILGLKYARKRVTGIVDAGTEEPRNRQAEARARYPGAVFLAPPLTPGLQILLPRKRSRDVQAATYPSRRIPRAQGSICNLPFAVCGTSRVAIHGWER